MIGKTTRKRFLATAAASAVGLAGAVEYRSGGPVGRIVTARIERPGQ